MLTVRTLRAGTGNRGFRMSKNICQLKQLRVRAKITQRELSGRSGVPRARISEYETGRLDPFNMTVRSAARLAESMGVTLDEMFPVPCGHVSSQLPLSYGRGLSLPSSSYDRLPR